MQKIPLFNFNKKEGLKMDKKVPNGSTKLAGRTYDTSDYKEKDSLSNGLATTHEQVSDTYMEGEIGAVTDDKANVTKK